MTFPCSEIPGEAVSFLETGGKRLEPMGRAHRGQVTLRYWATGEFHSELGGGTVTQQGCPAKKGGQATRVDQD